jgi:hypothetical protein
MSNICICHPIPMQFTHFISTTKHDNKIVYSLLQFRVTFLWIWFLRYTGRSTDENIIMLILPLWGQPSALLRTKRTVKSESQKKRQTCCLLSVCCAVSILSTHTVMSSETRSNSDGHNLNDVHYLPGWRTIVKPFNDTRLQIPSTARLEGI